MMTSSLKPRKEHAAVAVVASMMTLALLWLVGTYCVGVWDEACAVMTFALLVLAWPLVALNQGIGGLWANIAGLLLSAAWVCFVAMALDSGRKAYGRTRERA
ncbi:MAG: hypothetical protein JW834_00705 [Candidatus Diapherotrites archaeon]|nr:hypothetical protein [Candidatus Diapherotrites archaeon]